MKKHICFIALSLFCVFVHANTNDESTTITAAIPFVTETFDDLLGQGGNDGVWTTKYANSLNDTYGNLYLQYCAEANMCLCVGASHPGEVRITGIPEERYFLSFRVGAFLYDDEDYTVPVMVHYINNSKDDFYTTKISPNKFYNFRGTTKRPNAKGNIVIKCDEDQDNYKFFIDDINVYTLTSDIDKLKSASRIVLNSATYTDKQIQLLQQIVKENTNLTSIDLWSATINTEFSLEPGNPNCIIYDPYNVVTNTTNVARMKGTSKDINQYICENLVIKDGSPFSAMYAFTATNVSYDREFASTGTDYYSTICLPFSVSINTQKINQILEFTKNDAENGIIIFNDVNTIQANTPYVVSVAVKQPFLDMQDINAEVQATTPRFVSETISSGATSAEKEENNKSLFCGTYEQRTDIASNSEQTIYGFSNGKFVRVDDACVFKPFRAYVKLIGTNNAELAKSLKLTIFDEPTGVKTIRSENKTNTVSVYTTDGQLLLHNVEYEKVNELLPKGLYIINGKKLLKNK